MGRGRAKWASYNGLPNLSPLETGQELENNGGMQTLKEKLASGRFVITAELAPPVSFDAADLLAKAAPLKGLADAVNVTDGAGARAHLGPVAAAAILLRVGASTGAKARRNGFTFGLLYQREQQRQVELIEQAVRLRL